jgi:agmatinase
MDPHPFDPDAAADPAAGLFGLDHTAEAAELHVIPAPFDATCSYRRGAAEGPAAVLAASHQVELFDLAAGEPWKRGIHMQEPDGRLAAWNAEARDLADGVIERAGRIEGDAALAADLARVNELSARADAAIEGQVAAALSAGKRVVLLGGDHSTALGSIRAHARHHRDSGAGGGLGILHLDAHADLRVAFEGFERSHASVLHNALEAGLDLAPDARPADHPVPGAGEGLTSLVQVGLRDLSRGELDRIERDPRIHPVFDHDWAAARAAGEDLGLLIAEAIEHLPASVYLSLDIDGLDPTLCPSTGTPVPGGLGWHEAWLWIDAVRASGRRLVGADLVEVSPGPAPDPATDTWDAMVGARLLHRILAALA